MMNVHVNFKHSYENCNSIERFVVFTTEHKS
jgi:hypothetical protein